MEENRKELSPEQMRNVTGGFLTCQDMEWLEKSMRHAKQMGATLEQFLESGGGEQETVEFCKYMWDKITI